MPEQTAGTPAEVQDTPLRNPQESTCVHTKKIYDSCQSKDCLEDLRVYPTRSSQSVLDGALSIRPGSATLLHVHMDVQPVGLGRGNYTVDMRVYYRLTAEAAAGCARYAPVTGLAVFDKRCILFGSEGRSRRFTSDSPCQAPEAPLPTGDSSLPTAVCEAVDPLILSMRLAEGCNPPGIAGEPPLPDVPQGILSAFDEELVFSENVARKVYCTLGQFTLLYMERDTQLLIPMYDYCMPERECTCDPDDDNPCDIFQQVEFPVGDFFPPNTIQRTSPAARLTGK